MRQSALLLQQQHKGESGDETVVDNINLVSNKSLFTFISCGREPAAVFISGRGGHLSYCVSGFSLKLFPHYTEKQLLTLDSK